MPKKLQSSLTNWWFEIGEVTTEDIENVHMKLASPTKYQPNKTSYEPNVTHGIKYAITAVYIDNVTPNIQSPHMKVTIHFFLYSYLSYLY